MGGAGAANNDPLGAGREREGRAGTAGGARGAACAQCASWAPGRCGPRSWRGRVPKDNADRERRGRGWLPSPESEPWKTEGKPTSGAGMRRGPEKVLARSLEDGDLERRTVGLEDGVRSG